MSTTTTSSAQRSASRQRAMVASTLKVGMTTERVWRGLGGFEVVCAGLLIGSLLCQPPLEFDLLSLALEFSAQLLFAG